MDSNLVCEYCGKRAELYPVKAWNKDEYRYYCKDHVDDVRENENLQQRRFVEYYSDEHKRRWLSEEKVRLWERLRRQI